MNRPVFGRSQHVKQAQQAKKARAEAELAGLARVLVRAGYVDREQASAQLAEAIAADVPDELDPRAVSGRLIAAAAGELVADEPSWAQVTDVDRLFEAFGALRRSGLEVLQYCTDQHAAMAGLRKARGATGVLFCTDTDVWHAVDHGMLELKVWHRDAAGVLSGDPLLDLVLAALYEVGLAATFDEGRVEVTMRWQRRVAWALTAGGGR